MTKINKPHDITFPYRGNDILKLDPNSKYLHPFIPKDKENPNSGEGFYLLPPYNQHTSVIKPDL